MKRKSNTPKKHHYVPQFYLKQFSSSSDANKVTTLRFNGANVIRGKSAIKNIGYEDHLYSINDSGINTCIEESINHDIESPITQSSTWQKIAENKPESLSKMDMPAIYFLARHLQARNIESYEFIVREAHSEQSPSFAPDYTQEEREMQAYIRSSPNNAKEFFLLMSKNMDQYYGDFEHTRVTICVSDIPLRTSTNPSIFLPIDNISDLGFEFGQRNYWLPLSRSFGALVMLQHRSPGFTSSIHIPIPISRHINKAYIIQMLEMKSLRYCIADDETIEEDLNWAHYFKSPDNERKYMEHKSP